jgi:hypothetical protein
MINPRIACACALTAGALLAAAACGSSTGTSTGAATRTTTVTVTTTRTSGATTPASTRNLPVSDALRQQLLRAGARATALPAGDFAGLVPGRTYYAYDPASSTYWAGAQLIPAADSAAGKAAVVNEGAYWLFAKSDGVPWHAFRVGMTGARGEECPVNVPAGVLAVWGWRAGTCKAPG